MLSLLCIVSIMSVSFRTNETGNLTVSILNIRNAKGEIECALFNKADGFANDVTKSYKRVRGEITNGTCSILFDGIPYGEYAVEMYHDENNNKQFDETWYGMPTEGVGVSNNPKVGVFSPPKFETARFTFDVSQKTISIQMKYL